MTLAAVIVGTACSADDLTDVSLSITLAPGPSVLTAMGSVTGAPSVTLNLDSAATHRFKSASSSPSELAIDRPCPTPSESKRIEI
jgi:hypothetical protein